MAALRHPSSDTGDGFVGLFVIHSKVPFVDVSQVQDKLGGLTAADVANWTVVAGRTVSNQAALQVIVREELLQIIPAILGPYGKQNDPIHRAREENMDQTKPADPSASCAMDCYSETDSQLCESHAYPCDRQDLADAIAKYELVSGCKPVEMRIPTVMWADWCCKRYFVDVDPNEPFLGMRLVMFADQFRLD